MNLNLLTRYRQTPRIMRVTIRQRLARLICCMMAINLLAAPMVHASWVNLDGPAEQGVDMSHRCKHAIDEAERVSAQLLQEAVNAAGEMQCEHDSTCKVLCGISASMLHQECALSSIDKSDRWLSTDTLAVKSSFLSRLERPPRL